MISDISLSVYGYQTQLEWYKFVIDMSLWKLLDKGIRIL